jgi:hypothetical protein
LRGPDCWDYATDFWNVVGQDNTTEKLQKSDNESLLVCYRKKISKSNGHHSGRGPVVTPHVLNVPDFMVNVLGNHPVFVFVDFCHGKKDWCNKMGKDKVENDDLEKFVILVLFQAVDKSSPEECQIGTGDCDSDEWKDKEHETILLDQMNCCMFLINKKPYWW